jgi:hypothetical protein
VSSIELQGLLLTKILEMRFSGIDFILACACLYQNTLGFSFNNAKSSNIVRTRSSLQMNDQRKVPNKRDRSITGIMGK